MRVGAKRRIIGSAIAVAVIVGMMTAIISGLSSVPPRSSLADAVPSASQAQPITAQNIPVTSDPPAASAKIVWHTDPKFPGMRYATGDLSKFGPPPLTSAQQAQAPVQQAAAPPAAPVRQASVPQQVAVAPAQQAPLPPAPVQQMPAPQVEPPVQQTKSVVLAAVGPDDRDAEIACQEWGVNLDAYRQIKEQSIEAGVPFSEAPHYILFLADVATRSTSDLSHVIPVGNALVADDGNARAKDELDTLTKCAEVSRVGNVLFDVALKASQKKMQPNDLWYCDSVLRQLDDPNAPHYDVAFNRIIDSLSRGRS